MYKRILVPLDGSENAEKVIPFATSEAQYHDAVVVLLRIVAPLRQSLMTSPNLIKNLYEQIEQIASDYLETIAEKIRGEGVKVETVVGQGPPAQKIHETMHYLMSLLPGFPGFPEYPLSECNRPPVFGFPLILSSDVHSEFF